MKEFVGFGICTRLCPCGKPATIFGGHLKHGYDLSILLGVCEKHQGVKDFGLEKDPENEGPGYFGEWEERLGADAQITFDDGPDGDNEWIELVKIC